jgi:hypothetical protein
LTANPPEGDDSVQSAPPPLNTGVRGNPRVAI